MSLEEFLKTYFGIERVEVKEDGAATLTMVAKEGEREQCVNMELVPQEVSANITKLNQTQEEVSYLQYQWFSDTMERQSSFHSQTSDYPL